MEDTLVKDDKIYIKRLTESLYNIIKVTKKEKVNLSVEDRRDIEEIIDCLHELEENRFKAHHIWEIESIKYEALRYKLTHYPSKITEEIQKAVTAARGMNGKSIDDLRLTLTSINDNIDNDSNYLDQLNIENEKLIPELNDMKIKYDMTIVLLNKHLSIKADRQIGLNQIRDTIKKNNEKIVNLEEDVFHLKEQMIKERASAREEKKRLLQETNQTQEKLNIQSTSNNELNKIYLNLKHEVAETSMIVTEKSSLLRKYVKTIGELRKRQDDQESKMEDTKWSNVQLKEEIKHIEEMSLQSKYDFQNYKNQLDEEIVMLKESVTNETMIQYEILSVKEQALEELQSYRKIQDEVALNLKSLIEKLKNIEEDCASKAGDVGKLVFEMEEMERNIIEAKEMHNATIMAVNSQINSLKLQLEKERKERIEVQKDNSSIQEQINIFRAEHAKFMREINAKINEAKSEHSRLQTQYQQLQRKIEEEIKESKNLRISIKENTENFHNESIELDEKLRKLTKDIFEMEKNEEEIKQRLENNEPSLNELTIYYDKHLKDYEKLKKDLVGLKNRKAALDDGIERTKRSIGKETVELEQLKTKKELSAIQLDSQIESESLKRNEIEKEIYVLGCKTSTIKEEIINLQNSIKEIDYRSRILRDNWEKAIRISCKMKQDITSQKTALTDGWTDDNKLELEFRNKEFDEITKLKLLLEKTEERGIIVADISDKLYKEIQSFGQFLSIMANASTVKEGYKANKMNTKSFATLQQLEFIENSVKPLLNQINEAV